MDALGELADANEPGFHATSTLDFIVVLTGTLELELDDGARTLLNAGDAAVLNGVRHRWSNAGQGVATLFAAQV
ncbi:MAG: cupin domain-containing protein, partial [Sphingomonas sp.]|nr:cupin domain-containing protein [Sphingomonas sp.]